MSEAQRLRPRGRALWELRGLKAASCPPQILCMHGGLSPELKSLEQIKRIGRPTDVPDTGLLCDLLWADPDKEIQVCPPPSVLLYILGYGQLSDTQQSSGGSLEH